MKKSWEESLMQSLATFLKKSRYRIPRGILGGINEEIPSATSAGMPGDIPNSFKES